MKSASLEFYLFLIHKEIKKIFQGFLLGAEAERMREEERECVHLYVISSLERNQGVQKVKNC